MLNQSCYQYDHFSSKWIEQMRSVGIASITAVIVVIEEYQSNCLYQDRREKLVFRSLLAS